MPILDNEDIYYTKILAIWETYGFSSFTDYWIQNDGSALIARLDSSFIIALGDNADVEEIKSFCNTVCFGNILCGDIVLDFPCTGGAVMSLQIDNSLKRIENQEVNLNDVYLLLASCADENFAVPDYDSFMLDMLHKLKKSRINIQCQYDKNKLVSVAMANIGGKKAILTAVATDKEYRHYGFGSKVVKTLIDSLSDCECVYLQRADGLNEEFYKFLGFKNIGKWIEYHVN